MSLFGEAVLQFWRTPFMGAVLYEDAALRVVANPALGDDERVTVLRSQIDGSTAIAVSPDVAAALEAQGLFGFPDKLTVAVLREALSRIGIRMHGADNLYYLPLGAKEQVLAEGEPADIRRLGASDAGLFARFEDQVEVQDREAAQVGLADWCVYGVLDRAGELLCVGSTYPWGGAVLADIGVLTRASARGRGHAKRLVRAMAHQHELQYRSRLDNPASMALAQAAGLALFGSWEIPSPE